jgi:hypothetical protein
VWLVWAMDTRGRDQLVVFGQHRPDGHAHPGVTLAKRGALGV